MIKFETKALAKALAHAGSSIAKTPVLPCLECALIRFEPGSATIIGTNLETLTAASLAAETSESGSILLPGHKLLSIIKGASSPTVEMKQGTGTKADTVMVKTGAARFRVKTLPSDSFPTPTKDENTVGIKVPAVVFMSLLECVRSAMAKDDVRYYLCGAMVKIQGGMLKAVAADGHRMHYAEMPVPDTQDTEEIIIPRNTVELILSLDHDPESEIPILVGKTSMEIEVDRLSLWSKTIAHKYVEYERVIPATSNAKCTMVADEIAAAMKRCMILSKNKQPVRIALESDLMQIEAATPAGEELTDSVKTEFNGRKARPESVGIAANYFYDAINALGSQKISIVVEDGTTGVIVSPEHSEARFAVISPVRM